jgi:hypothetical protein
MKNERNAGRKKIKDPVMKQVTITRKHLDEFKKTIKKFQEHETR